MKDERTIYVRIKIGNRTFDNDNVISVDYDAGSLSGEVFAIGSTYSNSIKITFSELVEGLKELDEVTYEIGIKLPNGTIEYVPMGVFVINDAIEMDRNNNKTTIECMDKMVMMGGAYVSSLNYPAAIREVALEIANKAGVVVDSTSFARLSADVITKPEGYTYREAIGLIAQFEAGFATFNRYGKLEIRTLSDPNFAIPPDNYFSKGLVKNEVFFRLGGISCTTDDSDTVIQSGNTAGNQVVLENRVMTKALLDKIYQKIQTINYYPFSLSWQGNPVIEAGDWIEVEDLQGNKFKTPNLNYSLSFNGGLSAKSSAETVTQSDITYQYKSPLQQKIEWIHARIDAAGGNVVYEGIDEPTNPKEGDLWFKVIGPDKEILIYTKREDGTLFWDPQISTADINKIAKELELIIEQADLDRTKAEQDFESAKQEAKQYTEAKAQEFDNQLLIVNQNVLTATNSANAAVLKADKAIEDAGFMRVDVDAAKVNAIDALTKAQSATDNVNSLSTSFDALTQTVGFKAEKAQVNALSGVIDQHTLDITANAQAINARLTSAQVDSLVTDKGYVNQSQLTATSSQWNLALTQVSTDLSNLEITDRNLIKYSDKFYGTGGSGAVGVTPSVTADGNLKVIAAAGNGNWLNGFMPTTNVISEELKEGDKFTISFTIKSANSTGIPDIYLKPGMGYFPMKGKMGTEFSTVYYTGIWKTANAVAFHMGFSRLVGTFIIKDMKLQKGEKPTGWSPAIEDMATLEKFTTLEATVNGINTVVGTKASQTQVTQLAGQITSKVESSTYNSKMTQLDSAINLRVVQSDVTAAILADKNIKDTRNDNQMPNWYFSNYPNKEAREFKLRSVLGLPGASTYVQLTTKVPWTETSGGVPIQIAESNDGVYQRASNSAATAWLAWDKVAESGKLISQINVSTEGILLQGKRIQLDGDVTMNTAFVTRLDVLALSAVYADIPTIRNKVLITDVVTTNMIKADAGLFDKVFINDAVVQKLTVKSSFISSVKAIDITADKITGGTANFANFNAINFNANSITSGTVSGASSTWNLNTGLMNFTNPSTGDLLQLMQGEIRFQNGAQGRYLKYQSEGLLLQPFASNTGTSKNTALHLIGGGPGSYQYIQFVSQDLSGVNMRLQAEGQNMTAFHGSNGSFIVSKYGDSTATGTVISGGYETRHPTGVSLKIAGDSISTPRDGSRNIYLTPQGTGSVVSGAANGTRYTFVASDFVKQSSRDTKTNIIPLESGLDNIRQLRPVSYNKIDKLNRGIFEIEKGFIAEDSLMVATVDGKGIYDSHITAYLVKGVQELDQKVIAIDSLATTANSTANDAMNIAIQVDSEVQQMKNKIIVLEKEIKTLKGAV